MSETVRIRAIAAGGDGVGSLADGRTVFVPRTAVGDEVTLADITRAKRFARARAAAIVAASPDRATPRCPHYEGDACGGCQLQHLTLPAQEAAKAQIVSDALRRIGHQDGVLPGFTAGDTAWEYRAKITLAAKAGRIGFHQLGRPDRVFQLKHCHIARPELNTLWRAISGRRELLPGNLEHLVLRVDRSGGRHAILQVQGTTAWTGAQALKRGLDADGVAATLWWEPEGGVSRTVAGAAEAYPAMVFEQVNPSMGDRVRTHAVNALGAVAGKHIWDLYAGIGETTDALAGLGASVESVEMDARAVRLAESRASAAGIVRHAGRVEDVLDRLGPADFVVANPPRTGLAEAVTSRLSERPPSRLVYISCDPATLARDVARLRGMRVTAVHAFDLFPQTAHVESVLVAERV